MGCLFFEQINYEGVIAQVASFLKGGRPCLSNYFGVSREYDYELYFSASSLIVKQINGQFSRLYFMSRDVNDLSGLLNSLDDCTYVFNIPSKNGLEVWSPLLNKIPFELYGKYYRYYNKGIVSANSLLHSIANEDAIIEAEGFKLCKPADVSDFEAIKKMLFDTFDIYTDHLPSDSQLMKMIEEKRIFVNRRPDDGICGLAAFETTGKKCYQNFWVDNNELGLYLMRGIYEQMIENNISITDFWVADWNKSVIKLHKMLGAVPDGMIDVTYIANK